MAVASLKFTRHELLTTQPHLALSSRAAFDATAGSRRRDSTVRRAPCVGSRRSGRGKRSSPLRLVGVPLGTGTLSDDRRECALRVLSAFDLTARATYSPTPNETHPPAFAAFVVAVSPAAEDAASGALASVVRAFLDETRAASRFAVRQESCEGGLMRGMATTDARSKGDQAVLLGRVEGRATEEGDRRLRHRSTLDMSRGSEAVRLPVKPVLIPFEEHVVSRAVRGRRGARGPLVVEKFRPAERTVIGRVTGREPDASSRWAAGAAARG